MVKVVRKITYESDSTERMDTQIDQSLGEGVHNFGDMKITVETLEMENIRSTHGESQETDGAEKNYQEEA